MSWSAAFVRPVLKNECDAKIDTMKIDDGAEPWMQDQLRTAQQAAKLIANNVPGPFISVSLNGHANGVGWQGKPGWCNDSITVTVTQITAEDMEKYHKESKASGVG